MFIVRLQTKIVHHVMYHPFEHIFFNSRQNARISLSLFYSTLFILLHLVEGISYVYARGGMPLSTAFRCVRSSILTSLHGIDVRCVDHEGFRLGASGHIFILLCVVLTFH